MIVISQIEIARSVDDVWSYFTNPDNIKLWRSGFSHFDAIQGDYASEGALIKSTFKKGSKSFEYMEEFRMVRPLKELYGRFSSNDAKGTFLYIFTDVDGATRLTLELDIEPRTTFLTAAFYKSRLTKRMDADFDRLKALLEKGREKRAGRRRSGSAQLV